MSVRTVAFVVVVKKVIRTGEKRTQHNTKHKY